MGETEKISDETNNENTWRRAEEQFFLVQCEHFEFYLRLLNIASSLNVERNGLFIKGIRDIPML